MNTLYSYNTMRWPNLNQVIDESHEFLQYAAAVNNMTDLDAAKFLLSKGFNNDVRRLLIVIYSKFSIFMLRRYPEINMLRFRYDMLDIPAYTPRSIISIMHVTRKNIIEILNDTTIYEFEDILSTGVNMHIIDPDVNVYAVREKRVVPYDLGERYNHVYILLSEIAHELEIQHFGFVIAGGIFSYIMGNRTNTEYYMSDLDLFIIANNREEAIQKVMAFCNHMRQFHTDKIYITNNCITFKYTTDRQSYIDVQLVLRWHERPEQVIEKFDLAPAMIYARVVDDELRIYCNAEAKFAYQTGYMIANIERRRNNYAYRLKKYMSRGFGVLMFDCDLSPIIELMHINENGSRYKTEDVSTDFVLDNTVYTILSAEDNYLECSIKKIRSDGTSYNYYCVDKSYVECEIILDNISASINDIDSSTITGVLDHQDFFTYKPIVDFTALIEKIRMLVDMNKLIRLFRMMHAKKILTVTQLLQLLLLLHYNDRNGIITCLTAIFSSSIMNLHDTYAVVLEYYNNPIYDAKCPLRPDTSTFYGNYYVSPFGWCD